MDFALMIPLMLSFVPLGQSLARQAAECRKKCPPGYYAKSRCPDGNYMCETCSPDTFISEENTRPRCERCIRCRLASQVQIKECTIYNNTVCDCKSRFNPAGSSGLCVPSDTDGPECDCEQCQRTSCGNKTECRKKCEATLKTTTSPPTLEDLNLLLWLLPLVVVSSLVLLWLLLFFTKKLLRNRDCGLIWSANKDLPVEDLHCREPHSHRGSSRPTMPTVHMYEEAPMISCCQSPSTAAPPAPAGLHLPDLNHAAAVYEEQPDLWPAIVLYTIIKAVPLRRWKEFLRLLAVADHQMERVELEAGVGQSFMEKQYQMLRLWSQRSSATLADVSCALGYMNLSGCAQLLQESLEKLDWRPEPRQRGPTSFGLSGASQEAT